MCRVVGEHNIGFFMVNNECSTKMVLLTSQNTGFMAYKNKL